MEQRKHSSTMAALELHVDAAPAFEHEVSAAHEAVEGAHQPDNQRNAEHLGQNQHSLRGNIRDHAHKVTITRGIVKPKGPLASKADGLGG